jgi:hypothetical protein
LAVQKGKLYTNENVINFYKSEKDGKYINYYYTFGSVKWFCLAAMKQDSILRDEIKTAVEKQGNTFFESAERLHNRINSFNFSEKYPGLTSRDAFSVIEALLDSLNEVRNQIVHTGNDILDILVKFYEDAFLNFVTLLGSIKIESSPFVRVEHNAVVYCLISIVDGYSYKDKYFTTVKKDCEDDINKLFTPVKKSFESINIQPKQIDVFSHSNIDFIKLPSGNIEYKICNKNYWIEDFIKPFAISKYPISYRQFFRLIKENPTLFKTQPYIEKKEKDGILSFLNHYNKLSDRDKNSVMDSAVYYIDWYAATEYCDFLSRENGLPQVYKDGFDANKKGFRLPTYSEWYYAATCGKGREMPLPDFSNIIYSGNRGKFGKVADNSDLYENDWKICGMLGNINEWTSTNSEKIKIKKFESKQDDEARKVIAGAAFASGRDLIKYEYSTDVSARNMHNIGIRVVISL